MQMELENGVQVTTRASLARVSALFMLMALGCGSRVEGDSTASGGGPAGAGAPAAVGVGTGGEPGNAGAPSRGYGDSYGGGGNVGNEAAVPANGGSSGCSNPSWNSSGFDYGGNFGSSAGVDCSCDACGDATCSGTLGAACERVVGCRATLAGLRSTVDQICATSPAYAFYSKGEQIVIAFGSNANGATRMVFDNQTGVLVGITLSAHDGRACYLGGKTDMTAGLQVTDPVPTCRLCAAATQDPDVAAFEECPSGAIP
jgi:hypothetical protein